MRFASPSRAPIYIGAALLAAALLGGPARALTVPGADGSDGELNITQNTTIDLSNAVKGAWNGVNTSPGNGVYDPTQWAVVFRYSKVTIATGATLSFANHPSKAPVVWLVSGDVTINGTVSLDGKFSAKGATIGADGGPGGAPGGDKTASVQGPGFGLGGSNFVSPGSPGSFATASTRNDVGRPYGGPSLVPLVGGSGGSYQSGGSNDQGAGAGGGGAILIASTGTITVAGQVNAKGGESGGGYFGDPNGLVSGSGGGIRLCASEISGGGVLDASGGTDAGSGRIRLEAAQVSGSLQATPAPSSALITDPVILWPPDDAPRVRVTSVNALPVATDANSYWKPSPPDLTLAGASLYAVTLETKNVPTDRKVRVKMTPASGTATLTEATLVSGDQTLATWTAQVQFTQGFCTVQARVDPE